LAATTDLIATLPRHTGETLARANGLRVLACPMPIPVRQHLRSPSGAAMRRSQRNQRPPRLLDRAATGLWGCHRWTMPSRGHNVSRPATGSPLMATALATS
jgi:hypothetical protein